MKAFAQGFVLGASEDGTVYYKKNRNEYLLEIEQKNPAWLRTVSRAIQEGYGARSSFRDHRGYGRLRISSQALYADIAHWRERYALHRASRQFQRGFLCGIFDAEGSVATKRFHVRVASKNRATIIAVQKLLYRFGIRTGKLWHGNVYVLSLYGKENLQRFSSAIGFRHPDKKARLRKLLRPRAQRGQAGLLSLADL